jgi:transposase-like protein
MDAVLRLLRGEPLEVLSRELGTEAHRLAAWRDDFLEGGKQSLKGQRPDRSPEDRQLRDAERKIGQLTMEHEILRAALCVSGTATRPRRRPTRQLKRPQRHDQLDTAAVQETGRCSGEVDCGAMLTLRRLGLEVGVARKDEPLKVPPRTKFAKRKPSPARCLRRVGAGHGQPGQVTDRSPVPFVQSRGRARRPALAGLPL